MRLTLLLEVYAPRELGAEGCETAAETVTQALMTALPEGLKLKTIQWGKSRLGKTAGMFGWRQTQSMRRTCGGGGGRDETVFTDFVLKGTVKECE